MKKKEIDLDEHPISIIGDYALISGYDSNCYNEMIKVISYLDSNGYKFKYSIGNTGVYKREGEKRP